MKCDVANLVSSRIPALLSAFCLLFAVSASSATAGQLLDVATEEEPGSLRVWVRDAPDKVPTVKIDGVEVAMTPGERTQSRRFQPVGILLDRSNVSPETLGKLRSETRKLIEGELKAGNRKVVIQARDEKGSLQLEAKKLNYLESSDPSAKSSVDETLDKIQVMESGDPRQPLFSAIPRSLEELMGKMGGSKKIKPWILVFSSLCVAPDAEGPDLSKFTGPIRIITWDEGLDRNCQRNREKWVQSIQAENLEIYNRDLPEQREGVQGALKGLSINDQAVVLSGIDYRGGSMKLRVVLDGDEDSGWEAILKSDTLPNEWGRQAIIKLKQERIMYIGIGFAVIIAIIIVVVFVRARASAVDFAKWEAVGEAEDLSVPMDDDAWNATIFQLTGAMPVIKASDAPAQLGPDAGDDGQATVSAPSPTGAAATAPDLSTVPEAGEADPSPSAATTADASPPVEAAADQTTRSPAAPTGDVPSTGMTVSIPVVDDGTAYEAVTPFEVGVLLNGAPVARKTKKFRKVFSIGRATDNRVVIQKDDTVHRYHVVVRPAMEGKEWWLEVSPTASNRTRLNGKDLRAGGRYRLPGRFRLELGEATEVRGRLSKPQDA